ncbi:MAG TPA: hypothetical protein VK814_02065 [Acidobacteriaceae bacterium]|jgi:hypothetical protein|nr:hypothetical protein [Acidobacteriaceae bacterium]
MPLHRLLAASFLASACVFPAAAQSPNPLLSPYAASPASPLVTSQSLSLGPSTPSTLKLTDPKSGSLQLKASPKDLDALVLHPGTELLHSSTEPPGLQPKPRELALLKPDATLLKPDATLLKPDASLLPQTNQPCAKLRSYNFKSQDLKSAHPHASSEIDCTPASAGHLKTIPATADTR